MCIVVITDEINTKERDGEFCVSVFFLRPFSSGRGEGLWQVSRDRPFGDHREALPDGGALITGRMTQCDLIGPGA